MELMGVTASAYLRRLFVSVAFSAFAASSLPAVAQIERQMGAAETVAIAGVDNILIRVAQPNGSLIVLTGGDGVLDAASGGQFTGNTDNVLIRNRGAFAASGFDVLLVEKGTNLADAVL